MIRSIRAKSIIAIFVATAFAPVATAGAHVNEPVIAAHYSSAISGNPSSGGTVVLRRDGSQATPVVANLNPEPTTSSDGFDWGDAAIGAGAALLVTSLAMAGSSAVSGRRSRTPRTTRTASQSA